MELVRDKPQKPIFIDLQQFDPQWDKTSGKLCENERKYNNNNRHWK